MVVKGATRVPSRGVAFLVDLDPTRGSQSERLVSALLSSPDELNHHVHTTIVAPLTTGTHPFPDGVGRKSGHVVLAQVCTADQERLRKRLGIVRPATLRSVLHILAEMFQI